VPTEFELKVWALACVAQSAAAQKMAVLIAVFFLELTEISGARFLLSIDINVELTEEQREAIAL